MRISDWSSDVCSSDLGEMMRQQLGLDHRQVRVAILQVGGDGRVQAPAPLLQQAVVGHLLPQGVLEAVGRLRRSDRKSEVQGKRVSVRVDLGGRRIIQKIKNKGFRTTRYRTTKT